MAANVNNENIRATCRMQILLLTKFMSLT